MSDNTGEDKQALLAAAAQAAAGAQAADGGQTAEAQAAGAAAGVGDLPRFLQAYFRHTAVDDLALAGPERIAAVAIEEAAFAAHRPQGRALVRVGRGAAMDPVREVISIVTDDLPFR